MILLCKTLGFGKGLLRLLCPSIWVQWHRRRLLRRCGRPISRSPTAEVYPFRTRATWSGSSSTLRLRRPRSPLTRSRVLGRRREPRVRCCRSSSRQVGSLVVGSGLALVVGQVRRLRGRRRGRSSRSTINSTPRASGGSAWSLVATPATRHKSEPDEPDDQHVVQDMNRLISTAGTMKDHAGEDDHHEQTQSYRSKRGVSAAHSHSQHGNEPYCDRRQRPRRPR